MNPYSLFMQNSKEEMSMKKFCPENLNDGYDHITAAVYNYNGTG